jgi:hypothetical protein
MVSYVLDDISIVGDALVISAEDEGGAVRTLTFDLEDMLPSQLAHAAAAFAELAATRGHDLERSSKL